MNAARIRLFAQVAALSVVIVAGAAFTAPPIRDAVTHAAVPGAHLARPPLYVVFAPVSDVFDAVSLLAVPQLIACVVWAAVLYAGWRVYRWRRDGGSTWREFRVGIRALLLLVLFVLGAAVLPRPMAALALADSDAVAFDVHSHTNFSHDARATFTVERNRAWHRAAGFHVAYITDHRCFDGAAEGERANPPRAGDGTVLLSGIEMPAENRHVITLLPPDIAVAPGVLEMWCERARVGRTAARIPVGIQTIPENLARIDAAPAGSDSGVLAIEISDGAPRGLAQAQRDRARILRLADSLDLALVAGSNNHGWGRTAVAWNVMVIPGWRALRPDSLDALIQARIRAQRRHAVTVITRTSPVYETSRAATYLALPVAAVTILDTISFPERVSWVIWLVGLAVVGSWRKNE